MTAAAWVVFGTVVFVLVVNYVRNDIGSRRAVTAARQTYEQAVLRSQIEANARRMQDLLNYERGCDTCKGIEQQARAAREAWRCDGWDRRQDHRGGQNV